MYKKGVIDRFEKDDAVILLEADHEEMIVAREQLPKEAEEGTWIIISKDSYQMYPSFIIDIKKTEEMKAKAEGIQEQLRKMSKESKFKSD